MSKPSIVLELQQLASDSVNEITDVLRKALIVATKLKLTGFCEWIRHELNGYPFDEDVPLYRKVNAKLEAINPALGRLIPFVIPPRLADQICNIKMRQPIAAIADLYGKHETISFPLSNEELDVLLRMRANYLRLEPIRTASIGAVAMVIDGVRSAILEWALQLEQEGILGEGMTFSSEEKSKAAHSQQIKIENFQGIIGNVSNSHVEQHLLMDVTQNDFKSLATYLRSLEVPEEDITELQEAIDSDGPIVESGSFGTKVKSWLGSMMIKANEISEQLGIAVSSGLLLDGIKKYYGL